MQNPKPPSLSRANLASGLFRCTLILTATKLEVYNVIAPDQEQALNAAKAQATKDGHDHLDGKHHWWTEPIEGTFIRA